MSSPCRICYSPYRREIEKLVEGKEMSMLKVAEKYSMITKEKKLNIYNSLRLHYHHNHAKKYGRKPQNYPSRNMPSFNADFKKAKTFEEAAKILLELGMGDQEALKELSIKDKLDLATKMEKAHLEGKKVRNDRDALILSAAKFLGGFSSPQLQEGEVIDGESVK